MTVSKWSRALALSSLVSLAPVAIAAVFASTALAGPGTGHSHAKAPLSKEEILESGKQMKEKLIKDGKVDASWKEIAAPDNAFQKEFKGGKKEWVVTFKNPGATDKAKETLYIFFTLNGNYLAANFTGE